MVSQWEGLFSRFFFSCPCVCDLRCFLCCAREPHSGCACILYDAQSFVYVSNDYSLIWVDVDIETASQKIQQVLKGHRESVSALLCHPTDPVMVSGGKDAMIVWDMQAGKMIARVLTNARGMHTAQVNCMGWICDGKALVTCSEDSFIMIWDVDAGYKKVCNLVFCVCVCVCVCVYSVLFSVRTCVFGKITLYRTHRWTTTAATNQRSLLALCTRRMR